MTRVHQQRGSTMLEFALLAPVFAAFLAGLVGVSMTFVRTMQSDQICKKTVQMAAAGADFDQDSVRAEVYALYGANALEDRKAVLYVTHIVREESGYRKAQQYAFGRVNRWTNSADTPESVLPLEPGEDAWVAEIWVDNDSLLGVVAPKELHSRAVL